jgi:hypothetical protein
MTDPEGFPRRFDPLVALIGGFELTQMLFVFAELGIADRLAAGPMTSNEVARAVDADPQSVHRLLRALSTVRIVAADEDGRFALTARGSRLRLDDPASLRPLAIGPGQPWWWQAWGGLLESVRSGTPAFDHVHGRSLYDFLRDDEAAAEIYGEYMVAFGRDEAAAAAEAYDFGAARVVVDVGGGRGGLLEAILERHAGVRGILFDQPATIERAGDRFAPELAARIELVGGDFLEEVPAGGDVYVLRQVLHDWDDAEAIRILESVRRAAGDSASLLVIQDVIPESASPGRANLVDVALLVLTGGRERTEDEYRRLLEAGGFALARALPLPTGATILEARPR